MAPGTVHRMCGSVSGWPRRLAYHGCWGLFLFGWVESEDHDVVGVLSYRYVIAVAADPGRVDTASLG